MDEKPFDSINVIPFVDIMLVLLTIVLTTSSFIATGRIPIHLPKAQQSPHDSQAARVIEIAADGSIHVEGRVLTMSDLKAGLAGVGRETPILIRADKQLSLQHFIDVADALKQLQFKKVAVQTESG